MAQETVVYVIAGASDDWPVGPVKVGITSNLVGRLSSLQTGSPVPLICVQAFPVPDRESALALEKAFHTVLKQHRMAGEWFDMDPLEAVGKMADNIESMLSHHLGFDGDELEAALEATGVNDTRKRLAKATAVREDELIQAMQ